MEKVKLEKSEIGGKSINEFLADVLLQNENQSIEIERGKLAISGVKQINNNLRLQLDVEKLNFKKLEFEAKQGNVAVIDPA